MIFLKFKRGEKLSFIDLYDGACVYYIRNIDNGKIYIGSTKNYRARISVHVTKLRVPHIEDRKKFGGSPIDMISDFEKGNQFESGIISRIGKDIDKETAKKMRSLEAFFIIKYDSVEKGYNQVYTNRTREWTLKDIRRDSEFIVSKLLGMD